MPWWGIALIVVGCIILVFILAYIMRGIKRNNPDSEILEFFLFDIIFSIADGICYIGDGFGECCCSIGEGIGDCCDGFGDGGGFDGGCD